MIIASNAHADLSKVASYPASLVETKHHGDGSTTMQLLAAGQSWSFTLRHNEASFALLDPEQRRQLALDGAIFLRGSLPGKPASWVRLSRIDDQWSGGFFDGRELYLLENPPGEQSLALYQAADIEAYFASAPQQFDHGGVRPEFDGFYQQYPYQASSAQADADFDKNATLSVPMTIVTDVGFNNTHGNNAAAVVASRINFIDGIYGSQVGVGITLIHLETLASNHNMTSNQANELLTQFQEFMINGAGSTIPFQGLAHLFTDRSIQGSTAGVAFISPFVLCDSNSGFAWDLNLASNTTSALVFAHETGHNINAPHDGEDACAAETFQGIMNPQINGSETFSDCSIVQMTTVLGGASCLVANPNLDLVFADRFET